MPSIDQLLGLKSVADLASMTDEQLLEHFKDSFLLERRLMDEALKRPAVGRKPAATSEDGEAPAPTKTKAKRISAADKLKKQKDELLELAKLLKDMQ